MHSARGNVGVRAVVEQLGNRGIKRRRDVEVRREVGPGLEDKPALSQVGMRQDEPRRSPTTPTIRSGLGMLGSIRL